MKTAAGTLRKRLENNEPLFNIVTNENIGEALHYAKLNSYDNFKILEQLDRKSCKASLEIRLSAILVDNDLTTFFYDKYVKLNGEVRSSYLVKTFLNMYYRIAGFAGVINLLITGIELPNIYKYIIEDELLSEELNALAEVYDITNPNIYSSELMKIIELHEASK